LIVRCKHCDSVNTFDQSNPYHAGFANQGFLYNQSGSCTLVWSSFDPSYEALVGQVHPWTLGPPGWAKIEAALLPSPDGTPWRSSNPPRCASCHAPIGRSIGEGEIYYFEYDGSVLLDKSPGAREFASALKPTSPAT